MSIGVDARVVTPATAVCIDSQCGSHFEARVCCISERDSMSITSGPESTRARTYTQATAES